MEKQHLDATLASCLCSLAEALLHKAQAAGEGGECGAGDRSVVLGCCAPSAAALAGMLCTSCSSTLLLCCAKPSPLPHCLLTCLPPLCSSCPPSFAALAGVEGEVESTLNEARGLAPNSPEPLQALASLRQQQGKDEEALQVLRQSMALWFKPAPEESEEEEEEGAAEEGKKAAAGGSGKKAAAEAEVRLSSGVVWIRGASQPWRMCGFARLLASVHYAAQRLALLPISCPLHPTIFPMCSVADRPVRSPFPASLCRKRTLVALTLAPKWSLTRMTVSPPSFRCTCRSAAAAESSCSGSRKAAERAALGRGRCGGSAASSPSPTPIPIVPQTSCHRMSSGLRPPSCCWSWTSRWRRPPRWAQKLLRTVLFSLLMLNKMTTAACHLPAFGAAPCMPRMHSSALPLHPAVHHPLHEHPLHEHPLRRLHARHPRARMKECTRASDYPLKKLYIIMVEFLHLSPMQPHYSARKLPASGAACVHLPCCPRPACSCTLLAGCLARLVPKALRSLVSSSLPPILVLYAPCRCWRACWMRTTRTPTSGCCWPCAARAAATRRARWAQVRAAAHQLRCRCWGASQWRC